MTSTPALPNPLTIDWLAHRLARILRQARRRVIAPPAPAGLGRRTMKVEPASRAGESVDPNEEP